MRNGTATTSSPQAGTDPQNPSPGDAKQLPAPADAQQLPALVGQAGSEPAADESRRIVTVPADEAGQRRVVKDVYLGRVGANVIATQMQPFVTLEGGKADTHSARVFVASLRESVQPRDAVEEMLLVQMAWTHARLARLSAIASDQVKVHNVRVVHDACDRAAATFRRQMLALAEYRRPPRADSFVAIRQANVAHQQVIANGESQDRNPAMPFAANELGSVPAEALPAHAGGPDRAAPVGPSDQAVGVEHRTQDPGGEGPRQPERPEAR